MAGIVSPKHPANSAGGTRRRFASGMPRGWANRARKAGISKQRIQKFRRIARRRGFSAVRRRTSFGSNRYRRRIRNR
jgi:hypothetical protein